MSKTSDQEFQSYAEFEKRYLPKTHQEREENRRREQEARSNEGNRLGIRLASTILDVDSSKKTKGSSHS